MQVIEVEHYKMKQRWNVLSSETATSDKPSNLFSGEYLFNTSSAEST
jgi:hypothetical protein